MSKKSTLRIFFSLLGLTIGILMVIVFLKQVTLNYFLLVSGVVLSIFSIEWFLNSRHVKIMTGISLIPIGLAGSLWTIWDFIQDFLYGKGEIGSFPLVPGVKILLVPYLFILGLFGLIFYVGLKLIKGKVIKSE